MQTLAGILSKTQDRLAALNAKTGRNDTDFDSAINAIPSLDAKTSADLSVSHNKVTAPAGYYPDGAETEIAEAYLTVSPWFNKNTGIFSATVECEDPGYVFDGSPASRTLDIKQYVDASIIKKDAELFGVTGAYDPKPATCTIEFNRSAWNYDICIGYTNGSGIPAYVNAAKGTSAVTISNVACDSMIAIFSSYYLAFATSPPYVYGKSNFGIYKAPTTSDTYTYNLIDD